MGKLTFLALWAGTLVLAVCATSALADNTWEPSTSGAWDVDDNWSAGFVPATSPFSWDTAVFTNSGTAVLPAGVIGEYNQLFMKSVGSPAVISITGGALYGNTAVLGKDAGTAGVINITSGTWINSSVTIGDAGAGTLVISGGEMNADTVTLGLAASGTGSLTLSGNVGGRAVLVASGISKGAGGGTLFLNGGILKSNGGPDFLSGFDAGDVTIGAEGALIDTDGNDTSITTSLSGTGALIKMGDGTLVLSGANTQGGGTRVEGGVVRINGGTSLGASLTLDGGALESGADVVVSQQVTLGASSGTIMTSEGNISITTAIEGSGGFTKTGTYTLSVSGSQTYLGDTRIEEGTFQITNGSLASASVDLAGVDSVLLFTDNGYQAGTVTGYGALRREGAGATILTGTATQERGTIVASGTLIVANGGVINHDVGDLTVGENIGDQATLLIASGAHVLDNTVWLGDAVGSSGTARVSAGGTWDNWEMRIGQGGTGTLFIEDGAAVSSEYARLGFSSTGAGMATVSGGTWNTGADIAIGFRGTGVLLIESGLVTGNNAVVGEQAPGVGSVTVSGGTWSNSTSLTVGNAGTGTLNLTDLGAVIISGTGKLNLATQAGASGTLNFGTGGASGSLSASEIAGGAGTAVVNFNHTGTMILSSALTGTMSVNRLANGTTIFTGNNAFSGTTTISGGALQIGDGGTTGSLTGDVVNQSILAFNRSDDFTFAGAISGAGDVFKEGEGKLTLTGSNSHTGDTVISEGVVIVLGEWGDSHIRVGADGTLGGTATLSDVTVSGTLAPGTSPGLLSIQGDLTMELGATLVMEFSGTGAGEYDQIAVQDLFTANGTLDLVILAGYTPVYGDSFQIFTTGGWDSGDFTITTNLGGDLFWDISSLESGGMLTVIPEPSTWTLLGLGSLVLLVLRRKQKAVSGRAGTPEI